MVSIGGHVRISKAGFDRLFSRLKMTARIRVPESRITEEFGFGGVAPVPRMRAALANNEGAVRCAFARGIARAVRSGSRQVAEKAVSTEIESMLDDGEA